MVQLEVTTILNNAEPFSWTMKPQMNSVQMVVHNSPQVLSHYKHETLIIVYSSNFILNIIFIYGGHA